MEISPDSRDCRALHQKRRSQLARPEFARASAFGHPRSQSKKKKITGCPRTLHCIMREISDADAKTTGITSRWNFEPRLSHRSAGLSALVHRLGAFPAT